MQTIHDDVPGADAPYCRRQQRRQMPPIHIDNQSRLAWVVEALPHADTKKIVMFAHQRSNLIALHVERMAQRLLAEGWLILQGDGHWRRAKSHRAKG